MSCNYVYIFLTKCTVCVCFIKVYEGLYAMSIRDFKRSANLFLDAVSTFTSYELMDYVTFVQYTVYISILALDR